MQIDVSSVSSVNSDGAATNYCSLDKVTQRIDNELKCAMDF